MCVYKTRDKLHVIILADFLFLEGDTGLEHHTYICPSVCPS